MTHGRFEPSLKNLRPRPWRAGLADHLAVENEVLHSVFQHLTKPEAHGKATLIGGNVCQSTPRPPEAIGGLVGPGGIRIVIVIPALLFVDGNSTALSRRQEQRLHVMLELRKKQASGRRWRLGLRHQPECLMIEPNLVGFLVQANLDFIANVPKTCLSSAILADVVGNQSFNGDLERRPFPLPE